MPKPLTPTSIKFTTEQKVYLKRIAKAEGHGKIGTTIKLMVDRYIDVAKQFS